jgi:hypothetical protein
MHYKIRANVYKLLGRGVVGSCFGARFLSVFFVVLCYGSKLLTINSPHSYFLCTNILNLVSILCPYHPPRGHWTLQLIRQSCVQKDHVDNARVRASVKQRQC